MTMHAHHPHVVTVPCAMICWADTSVNVWRTTMGRIVREGSVIHRVGCPDITTKTASTTTTADTASATTMTSTEAATGSEVTSTIDGSTCAPCPEVTTPAPETTTSCPTPQPDVDYCSENPCENRGTCVNTTGTYHCDCSNNWVGQNCTEGKSDPEILNF